MFLAMMAWGVTPAASEEASRVREPFPTNSHDSAPPKRRATRLGGIPAGSLEVTWELGRKSGRLETCSASVVRDHADLCGALGAAIDHLFAHDHGAGIALGAGGDVLGGQRSEGGDSAERDNEKAEGRLQHIRSPVRRWRCVVDDRCREGVFPGDVVICFICFVAGNL